MASWLDELLLPVIGGYWLLTHCNRWKYGARRQAGYHVFFRTSMAGLLLYGASWFILRMPSLRSFLEDWIPSILSPEAALSVVLGGALPTILNEWSDPIDGARATAEGAGDLLELLLQDALEQDRFVEVSLQSGKVYVGLVSESGIERYGAEEADIKLLPIASGHRSTEGQKLALTVSYVPLVFEEPDSASDLEVVVPMSEVRSARLFDFGFYAGSSDPEQVYTVKRRGRAAGL